MKQFLVILSFILIFSCEKEENNAGAIARVNDVYLYESDLQKALPENYTSEDSVHFRANFIKKWATEQLLVQKAALNIDTKKEIDELVAKYRKELLIDRYKEALLKRNLDTVVTESDIEAYYDKNKDIYRLNEELVKIRFLHMGKDFNEKKEVIKLFKSDDPADLETLEKRKLEFISSHLNDSIWVSFNDVRKKIPFLKELKRPKKIKFLQKDDSLGVYLVAVKDVLYRNDVAPKSYVKPLIRIMILHKRKLELNKEIEKSLLEDATKNKQLEIYQ